MHIMIWYIWSFKTTDCEACKEGWEIDEDKGCIDLNECLLEETPCKRNDFCVNTEGSYSCIGKDGTE